MTTPRTAKVKASSLAKDAPVRELTEEEEDAALVRAIEEGMRTERVSEQEIFEILEGRDESRVSE